MAIVSQLPGLNLFSNLPSKPPPNDHPTTTSHQPPQPPIPIPKYPPPLKSRKHPSTPPKPHSSPAFKTIHHRSKYYKPVKEGVISSDGDRTVVVGESGLSYHLPGAPFEFQFSYSETPKAKPLAIREPAFLPFAPPTMPRPWTGKAPMKKSKKNIRLFDSFNPPSDNAVKHFEMAKPYKLGKFPAEPKPRNEVLGKPLTKAEARELVKPYLSSNRQVNLGRDGLTHNMLELIHTHWRRQPVCKVRCLGVPTVDMNNVCRCLEVLTFKITSYSFEEGDKCTHFSPFMLHCKVKNGANLLNIGEQMEKTGGKIIFRVGGVAYLFRGRNYDPRARPQYPVMLWKPATPVYPKLIQEAPEGLTKAEADEFRTKGKNLPPICKLAKNGVYATLVKDVRNAFEECLIVKIDCRGLHASDYKKIGAKLKELVPCVLLSFDEEQILMWRGQDWKSMYIRAPSTSSPILNENALDLNGSGLGTRKSDTKRVRSSPKMMSLWNRAIESSKALLLDELELGPDALLEKVEEFETMSQATVHSYPALILSSEDSPGNSGEEFEEGSQDFSEDQAYNSEYSDEYDIDDSFEGVHSSVPLGLLPVDLIAEQLRDGEERKKKDRN